MTFDLNPPSADSDQFACFARQCYICGRGMSASIIAEPLLLPICSRGGCRQRASALGADHCRLRLADGNLCGAPLARLTVGGHSVCVWHAHVELDRLSETVGAAA